MTAVDSSHPALPIIWRFGRPHRRWLVRGLLGTLGWVGFRLAMPWPLKDVIEAAFPGDAEPAVLVRLAPAAWDPVLWLCGVYVLLAIGLGLAELLQRSSMTRFATRTVEDLRGAALRGVAERGISTQPGAHGDLIARLVGDATHLRRDLNGILVHASQNTLLFVAICGLLLVLSPGMGAFFLAGGLVVTVVGYRAARPVAKYARRQRASEGTYAATLEVALQQGNVGLVSRDPEEDDDEESRNEGVSLGVLGDSNLLIHVLLAGTVGAALLVGIQEVRAGSLSPGGLFLFVAYALTVHRRLVQLGRQLARSGKVRASVDRIASLLSEDDAPGTVAPLKPLSSALELSGVRLESVRGHGDKARLRVRDLVIPAGTRVAVLGPIGAGKTTLLRCIAGLDESSRGTIRWDGAAVEGTARVGLAYLPQDPVFPPQRVREILGLGDDAATTADTRGVLERVGAARVVARLPRGLQDRVGSLTLSKSEGRALGLAAILLGTDSFWVLDAPLDGLTPKAARRRLDEILDRADGRTLVISLAKLYAPERFDRVLVLKRGKIKFDGTPAEWKAWRARGETEQLPCAG